MLKKLKPWARLRAASIPAMVRLSNFMSDLHTDGGEAQAAYDDAMFDYSQGDYESAERRLRDLLAGQPDHFDAQLGLAMCLYRRGDFAAAIAEGKRAESMRPNEQLVHTNLSLFYMKSGDKTRAEHHGLQARIASWKQDMTKPAAPVTPEDDELSLAKPAPQAFKLPEKFPDMPWKKNKTPGAPPSPPPPAT
jgi:tetratricopeptide (TPR) repeat protein